MNNSDLERDQELVTGSEWCNTDPSKCNDLGNGVKLVNLSVDTLYISCKGLLKDGVTAYLDHVKNEAIESDEPRFGYDYMEDRILVIQPYGKRGYAYLLDSDDFSIKIGDGKVGPVIYAELRSHFLYTLGYEKSCQVVLDILKDFILTGEFIVSRIDLCADVVGWQPTPDLNERIITRSKNKKYYFDGNDFPASIMVVAILFPVESIIRPNKLRRRISLGLKKFGKTMVGIPRTSYGELNTNFAGRY